MEIESILNKLENSFYTKAEFEAFLQDYIQTENLENIYIEITRHNSKVYSYGKKSEDKSLRKRIFTVDHTLLIECSVWSKQRITRKTQDFIKEMVLAFIGADAGLDATEIPFYEKDAERGTRKKCDSTLRRIIESGKNVAVFMLDLDNFKNINESYGHECGSKILHEFSDYLVSLCENEAIVIHRSGDEFYLIMPYQSQPSILALSYKIKEEISNKAFIYENNKIYLTFAQGICLVTDGGISFEDAVEYAEKAYKCDEKDDDTQEETASEREIKERSDYPKRRNSVRIIKPESERMIREKKKISIDLAYLITRFGISSTEVFFNPYLDFISSFVSHLSFESSVEEFHDQIDKVINWIQPKVRAYISIPDCSEHESYDCEWSSEELLFAIFHGVCRNEQLYHLDKVCLSIRGNEAEVRIGDKICYHRSIVPEVEIEWHRYYSFPNTDHRTQDSRIAILVQIGYQETPIPDRCFYRVIKIDDRPITGGQLPDFWAGTLAELMEVLSENPCYVFVYGNLQYGKHICEILRNSSKWEDGDDCSYSFLQKKTKQSLESVIHCRKCLSTYLELIDSKQEGSVQLLTDKLIDICENGKDLPNQLITNRGISKQWMERTLPFDPLRLRKEDGCRVNTFEQAFPVVLEVIRTCRTDSKERIVTDQAGRAMTELANFKVVVTEPCSKDIPSYYNTNKDLADLEKYYDSIFNKKDGFFHCHLHTQYEAVIKHIVDLIKSDGLIYATRRAILVVPHNIDPNEKNGITPLGLVSIHISPRNCADCIVVDYSFTWRTVEAVVGFPYSLYGSIKYAEDILKDIRAGANGIFASDKIKMGSVSYNAYSLHMFQDEIYDKIVRGIINDVSR